MGKHSKTTTAAALLLLLFCTLSSQPIAHAAKLTDLFNTNTAVGKPQFLSVDEAFTVVPSIKGNTLRVQFEITPEHYIYKDQLKLTLPEGVTASPFVFNQSVHHLDDPVYGRVPVFDQRYVTATASLSNRGSTAIRQGNVTLRWQGCAKAGLCYPPESIPLKLNLAAAEPSQSQTTAAEPQPSNINASTITRSDSATAAHTSADALTTVRKDAVPEQLPSLQAQLSASSEAEADGNPSRTANAAVDTNSDGDFDSIKSIESVASTEGDEGMQVNAAQLGGQTNTASLSTAGSPSAIDADPFGLTQRPWLALGLLFIAGLLLAFTACVYPMIPIVANIVAHQHQPSALKGFLLTGSYAVGVASAYGLLGAVIAFFGEALGIIGWLQNPVILIGFAGLFVLLALYMLDALPLRLTGSISHKLHQLSQLGDSKLGSLGGSYVAGMLSALVVSPCVSAPLAGALAAVSTIGSPVYGFVALFVLGLGLSTPLMLLGTSQGALMPKAGAWMHWVKQGVALMLFAVSLLLLSRVFISSWMLLLWALWFMVMAVWAWQWQYKGRLLSRALALLLGVWAGVLTLGAGMGSKDPLYPLHSLTPVMLSSPLSTATEASGTGQGATSLTTATSANARQITTLAELDAITASTPYVLIDITADWCIECRIMDKNLFTPPPQAMANWQLFKLDISDSNDASKAVLSRYQIFGPPALLYYVDGKLAVQQVGEIKRKPFEQTLLALTAEGVSP